MASFRHNLFFQILLLALASAATMAAGDNTTHLHFYMHDTVSGPSPTAVKVVNGPNSTGFSFGDILVVDDPLTEGPNLSSAPVGRAQGFYAMASQEASDFALLLTVNLAFTAGQYNGSTLAVLSRDAIMAPVRELPVVGGTGAFRLARGYVLMKTYTANAVGDAVLEWDVYVTVDANPFDGNTLGGNSTDHGAPPPAASKASAAAAKGCSQSPLLLFILGLIVHFILK